MNTCPVQIFCMQFWSFTHMLVCLPAETVTAKPQLERIRSPSVVELASEDWDVPRQAAEATLSHGCGALVWLTRAPHTVFVLLCSKRHTKKGCVRAINQFIQFHFVGIFFSKLYLRCIWARNRTPRQSECLYRCNTRECCRRQGSWGTERE